MGGSSSLSWSVAAVLVSLVGGVTYLGHDHSISPGAVAGIYGAIVSGVLVGHFVTKDGGSG